MSDDIIQRLQETYEEMRKSITAFRLEIQRLNELGQEMSRASERLQWRAPDTNVTSLPTAPIPRALEGGPIYRGGDKIKGE